MNIKRAFFFYSLPIFILLVSACSGGVQPSPERTAPPVLGEVSAPTLAPTAVPVFHPTGVLVDTGNGTSLDYYDINGELLKTFAAPEDTTLSPENTCLIGSGTSSSSSVAVVYRSWNPEASLEVSDGNKTSMLRKTDAFLALACVPGQAALAFSEVSIENGTPHSALYADSTDNLSSTTCRFVFKDGETQTALLPVAVTAAAGNPKGIWYTRYVWGVGGTDLVFPITRGLTYYDLAIHENRALLEDNRNFQGISPDMKYAGSVDFRSDGDLSMRATELASGRSVAFPLNTMSKRGAGYAVFSPDNQFVAWMEGSGSLTSDPPDFQAVVRVGSLADEAIEAEVDSTAAAQALNLTGIAFLKPAGWLDDHTLLIEARGADWEQAYLLRFDLQSGGLATFSPGSFLGFSYP